MATMRGVHVWYAMLLVWVLVIPVKSYHSSVMLASTGRFCERLDVDQMFLTKLSLEWGLLGIVVAFALSLAVGVAPSGFMDRLLSFLGRPSRRVSWIVVLIFLASLAPCVRVLQRR